MTINYELHPADSAGVQRIDDTTSYRPLNSDTVKTIRGADTPREGQHQGIYDWRGYGWLKIASSHWEILGHGELEEGKGGQWLVTHFHKTIFTPEGIDVYSREKSGLSAEALEQITTALKGMEHEKFAKLVEALYEVRHDIESK